MMAEQATGGGIDLNSVRKVVVVQAPQAVAWRVFTEQTEPLNTLIDKVTKQAYRVTDEHVAAAKASGLSEDQIFEIVVCAAIGQAARQHDTALAALEAETKKE